MVGRSISQLNSKTDSRVMNTKAVSTRSSLHTYTEQTVSFHDDEVTYAITVFGFDIPGFEFEANQNCEKTQQKRLRAKIICSSSSRPSLYPSH
jgi:hypothetical protein